MNCLFNYGFKEAFLATFSMCCVVGPPRRGAHLGQVFAFHDHGEAWLRPGGQAKSCLGHASKHAGVVRVPVMTRDAGFCCACVVWPR